MTKLSSDFYPSFTKNEWALILGGSSGFGLAAAKKLVDGEIDSLPVVRPIGAAEEKTFEVVGRLTKTNITRLLVEMGQGKRR